MKSKTKIMITVMAVLILCAAAFTLLYLSTPHSGVEPLETAEPETEETTKQEQTSETDVPSVVPPVIPQNTETETDPLIVDVIGMERDPNPHVISADVIYEGEDNE